MRRRAREIPWPQAATAARRLRRLLGASDLSLMLFDEEVPTVRAPRAGAGRAVRSATAPGQRSGGSGAREDPAGVAGDASTRRMRRSGARLIAPLRHQGRVLGALVAYYERRSRITAPRRAALQALADLLADQVAGRALREAHVATLRDLERRALFDPLTGLPNRPHFTAALQAALAQVTPEGQLAVLVLDLDHFSWVNDTLGHPVGDRLLAEVGARLRSVLGADDLAARIGSDEFALLLRESDPMRIIRQARKILALLGMPFDLAQRTVELGTSMGIAIAPRHGNDVATILRRAETGMHRARVSGSTYTMYSAEQELQGQAHLALLGDLREALAQDQFFLHYQPLLRVEDGALYGVEALVRWQHPLHGLIPPDRFITLAEQTGIIDLLTLWVLETALLHVHAWEGRGQTIAVAINLSMHTLHDVQFPDTVAWLLRRYSIAPDRLTLEITESTMMAHPERSRDVLQRLSDLGVRLAIDDFGTGYSSLAYLKQLPVHSIKIDRSFVQGLDADPKDQAIVRAIVGLAHSLGLLVVAEGLEDQGSWGILEAIGCDVVQGYAISRPMAVPSLERWLQTPPDAWRARGSR